VGDYCDHKFFESDCIHVLVNAVNNDKVTPGYRPGCGPEGGRDIHC
jgi:hypothetical protein